jgi:hypothetical protein
MNFESAPQTGSEGDPYDMTSPGLINPAEKKAGDVDFDSIFAEVGEKYKGHTGESADRDIEFDPNATGSFDTKKIIDREDKPETLH